MLIQEIGPKVGGWALIRVNFDPNTRNWAKGGGHSFVSGPFFARLRYVKILGVDILGVDILGS